MELSLLRCGNLVVTPTLTDRFLGKAYFQMEAENTLDLVFYMGRPTLKQFIDGCLEPGKIVLGCFRHQEGAPESAAEFCGLGWVTTAQKIGRFIKADTGMCFFRRQTDKKQNLRFGRMMLQGFFDWHEIDVIFGTTPDDNKLALRYAMKLGMDIHGPIPDLCIWNGELADGWVSHISRAQWAERNRS